MTIPATAAAQDLWIAKGSQVRNIKGCSAVEKKKALLTLDRRAFSHAMHGKQWEIPV
jgi:hypothetical protein